MCTKEALVLLALRKACAASHQNYCPKAFVDLSGIPRTSPKSNWHGCTPLPDQSPKIAGILSHALTDSIIVIEVRMSTSARYVVVLWLLCRLTCDQFDLDEGALV